MKSLRFLRILALCVFAIGIYAVGYAGGRYESGKSLDGEQSNFPLLDEAHALIQEHYFGEIPDAVLLERGMINGLTQALGDPYTVYYEPARRELEDDELEGEYGGIGAFIERSEEGVFTLTPFAYGPAFNAGIEQGDILIAINGQALSRDMTMNDCTAMLRGPVGTTVELRIMSPETPNASSGLVLERQNLQLPTVKTNKWKQDARVGMLSLNLFSEKTPEEVRNGYQQLTSEGVEAIILDLRGNAGGLLDSAVEVAKMFLEDGLVMTESYKDGQEKRFTVSRHGEASTIPLVVLVDSGTASSAEIVAAALQENDRALLIGTQTYGKGSVQSIFGMTDGSCLHVTTARWTTPDGTILDGEGLSPDIAVASDQNVVDIGGDFLLGVLKEKE